MREFSSRSEAPFQLREWPVRLLCKRWCCCVEFVFSLKLPDCCPPPSKAVRNHATDAAFAAILPPWLGYGSPYPPLKIPGLLLKKPKVKPSMSPELVKAFAAAGREGTPPIWWLPWRILGWRQCLLLGLGLSFGRSNAQGHPILAQAGLHPRPQNNCSTGGCSLHVCAGSKAIQSGLRTL